MDKKEMRELLTDTKNTLSLYDGELNQDQIKAILTMILDQIDLTNAESDKMKKLTTIIQGATAIIVAVLAVLVKLGVI